jgi:hypothetical protein
MGCLRSCCPGLTLSSPPSVSLIKRKRKRKRSWSDLFYMSFLNKCLFKIIIYIYISTLYSWVFFFINLHFIFFSIKSEFNSIQFKMDATILFNIFIWMELNLHKINSFFSSINWASWPLGCGAPSIYLAMMMHDMFLHQLFWYMKRKYWQIKFIKLWQIKYSLCFNIYFRR